MKNLVFPRIFLHCVALGFIVSGLLLSVGSEVQILSGTPKGLAWAGPFLIYAFKNGDDPAGMLVSVLADFIDKTVITLTYCFFSTRIYSREILSTGEYVYILKGLAQFA